jgi:cytochrome c oxidase subunit II
MIKLLVFVVVVLAIITIAQIVRIAELVSDLSGDKGDEVVVKKDNKTNAILMMVFLIGELFFMLYQLVAYKDFLLPEPASAHGVAVDNLMNINFIIIGLVFLVTQVLLFWYAYKYQFRNNTKATFYPDNHKLETIWTIIPTIVLVIIIVYGLKTWNEITATPPANAMNIEIFGKQFDWSVRYAGTDNTLGKANYKLIRDNNFMGVDSADEHSGNDIITKELHLPVNKPILFSMRSIDIIHSAYLPHFRVQMNVVPGMITKFHFVPTKTTEEMRKITKDENFDYVLLCNKICGVAHFNMKMKVVVETEAEFNKWLKSQKTFASLGRTENVSTKEMDAEKAEELKVKPASDKRL